MQIRKATKQDIPGIARVYQLCWREQYGAFVPSDIFESLAIGEDKRWENILDASTYGDEVAFVAEENSEIIGYASGGPEWGGHPSIEAELYSLYVMNGHQGKGLGKRLLQSVAAALQSMSMNSMLVHLRSGNPTPRVYNALGAEYLGTQAISVDGVTIQEMTYGWKDLKKLTESSEKN